MTAPQDSSRTGAALSRRDRLAAGERRSGTGTWTHDHASGITEFSAGAWHLAGVASGPDGGPADRNPLDLVHPDDHVNVRAWWADVCAGASGEEFVSFRMVRVDGAERIVRMSGTTVEEPGGSLVSSGSVRDVTADLDTAGELNELLSTMKYAEQAAKLGSWSRVLPDGIPVWSDSIFEMMGEPVPGPGEPRAFMIEQWIHPDDLEWIALELGKTFYTPGEFNIVARVVLRDGTTRYFHTIGRSFNALPSDPQPTRSNGVVRDVTDQVISDKAILTLSRVSQVMAQSTDATTLVQQICDAAVETGGYTFASYEQAAPNPDGRPVQVAAAGSDRWLGDEHVAQVRAVLATGNPVVLPAEGQAPSSEPSATFLPITVDGSFDGVLALWSSDTAAFNFRTSNTLGNLAKYVGQGLARVRASSADSNDRAALRALLALSIDARERRTPDFHERRAQMCAAVGFELGLSASQLSGLATAAMLFDLGKLTISAEVLAHPPEARHAEEQALLRRYPQIGADMVSQFTWSFPLPAIVLQHQERFDGSGYPAGISGAAILIEARILGLVDAYHVLMEEHAAGLGMTRNPLRAIVNDGGGKFDPRVVDALVAVIEGGYQFRPVLRSAPLMAPVLRPVS